MSSRTREINRITMADHPYFGEADASCSFDPAFI